MPTYKYVAKNLENKTVTGQMEAPDTSALYAQLKAESLVLLDSKELEGAQVSYKMKMNEVSEFARQMADMVGSGITISRAIGILRDRDIKPKQREVLDQIYQNIQNGLTLSEALRLCKGTFPTFFMDMCVSGEASGQLEKTLKKMAEYYDKEYKLRAKVKSAMTYPIILAIMTVAVVMVLFTVLLPNFFKLFEGIELPAITQAMIAISNAVINYWYVIIIVVVGAIAIIQALMKKDSVRKHWDRWKLVNPMTGKNQKIIATARFARALSSLYSSGIPLVNCLTISSTLAGNKYIEFQFPQVIQRVRNGVSLSEAMKDVDGFDSKLAMTIYVGEESGRLVHMLESVADSFDFEAEMATERMVKIVEPVMIVIMAGIIGTVMLSVMLPIMSLYNNLGSVG